MTGREAIASRRPGARMQSSRFADASEWFRPQCVALRCNTVAEYVKKNKYLIFFLQLEKKVFTMLKSQPHPSIPPG
jgi:hypothetical protein